MSDDLNNIVNVIEEFDYSTQNSLYAEGRLTAVHKIRAIEKVPVSDIGLFIFPINSTLAGSLNVK